MAAAIARAKHSPPTGAINNVLIAQNLTTSIVMVVMPHVSVRPNSCWLVMPPALPCHRWFRDCSCQATNCQGRGSSHSG